jgi:type IV secretory pathway VirJ component
VTNSVVFCTSDFENLHDRHHDALQNREVVHRFVKGSLGGETSVLRTFRMSGKELVKKRVSQGKVS